jgi:hypothetical protein
MPLYDSANYRLRGEKMKRFQAVLCLLLAAAAARAEEVKNFEPKLHSGNWRVGAVLSLTDSSFSNGNSSYSLTASLPLQYFVADGFAFGGVVNWSTSGDSVNGVAQTATVVSLGAELAWFFWRHERFAAALQPEFFVNLRAPDLPTTYTAAGALDLEWFINPSVAIGPGFVYFHEFGTGLLASSNSYRFFVQLFIYL